MEETWEITFPTRDEIILQHLLGGFALFKDISVKFEANKVVVKESDITKEQFDTLVELSNQIVKSSNQF